MDIAYIIGIRSEKKVIKDFMIENKIKDNIAFEFDYINHKLKIYTKYPGYWVGKGGELNKKLFNFISERRSFSNWSIEYIEIHGQFVSSNEIMNEIRGII